MKAVGPFGYHVFSSLFQSGELAFRRGVRGFDLMLRLNVKSRCIVMPGSVCGGALASSVPEEELSAFQAQSCWQARAALSGESHAFAPARINSKWMALGCK